MSTYLIINIVIVIVPLLLSFDRKVHFYTEWKYVFPSIFITGFLFIVWDIWFTKSGVWHFNSNHLIGIELFSLPLEEYLFFFTAPYSCLFIYEVLKSYFPKLNPQVLSKTILTAIGITLLIIAALNSHKIYTFITFVALGVALLVVNLWIKPVFIGRFAITYSIVLIPFIISNGILSGTGLDEPVVTYNNLENLGIRILSIPVEDVFYGMLLILGNIFLFELFRKQLH